MRPRRCVGETLATTGLKSWYVNTGPSALGKPVGTVVTTT